MQKHNCRLFEIECRIPREAFNKDAFLADIKEAAREGSNVYAWGFGSKDKPGSQHADIVIRFQQEKFVAARIAYHRSDLKLDDTRPPYMEDCAKWLGGFIETASLKAHWQALYAFEKQYVPTVSLPFPLLTVMEGPDFDGALITGIALRLPGQSAVDRITIDRTKKASLLSVCGQKDTNLREFDLERELEELSPLISKFVRKAN